MFKLLETYLIEKLDELHRNNIKLKVIGRKIFSQKLNKLLNYAESKTKNNKTIQINLALNYGSKAEIVYALNIKKDKRQNNRK